MRALALLRRTAWVWLSVLTGVIVLIAAAQLPASAIQGTPITGPLGLGKPVPDVDGLRPTARWRTGGQTILVTVHPHQPCIAQLEGVTSTAPGRVEVQVRLVAHGRCTGPRHEQTFPVPKPAVVGRDQNVRILVDGAVYLLHPYVPKRHPRREHPTDRAVAMASPAGRYGTVQ